MSLQTSDLRYRLGFIGGGKLAGSVMRGLVRAKFCAPTEILVSEPFEATRTALHDELGVAIAAGNDEIAEKAEVILIGVKPGVVLDVVVGMANAIENKLVISLAAGIRVVSMEGKAKARFMRAMTNTPAGVCQAATAIAPGMRTLDGGPGAGARDFFRHRICRGGKGRTNRCRDRTRGQRTGVCLHRD